jgi:hypothetical protein
LTLLAGLFAAALLWLFETYCLMLLAGALHLAVHPGVPAWSFGQAFLVNAALHLLSAYWTVPLAASNRSS